MRKSFVTRCLQGSQRTGREEAQPCRGLRRVLVLLVMLTVLFSWGLFPVFLDGVLGVRADAVEDYVLGPEDEVSVIVWDHPDLTRKIRINLEGRISFPLIGEFRAGGLTPLELEKRLQGMLSAGYLVDPQVSILVTDYRSQKIFVIGEVNSPGAYSLSRKTSLVEALAMAGGVKENADNEITIVRPNEGRLVRGAVLPEDADPSEVTRVRLRDVLEGEVGRRELVASMDTVFVPKIKVFYVTGEVKRPGQYTFVKGMTVLQAVSTAGGFTDKAARRKIQIVRERDGRKVEMKPEMEKPIEPLDTIVVPESFW